MHASRRVGSVMVLTTALATGCSSDGEDGDGDGAASEVEPADSSAPATTESAPTTTPDPTASTDASTTTALPDTTPATTEAPAASARPPTTDRAIAGPPIHEPLAALIPAVDGIDTEPAVDVYWPVYDLPGGARAYAADLLGPTGRIAQIVIAEGSGANQLEATYISTIFRDGVQFLRDSTEGEDGTTYILTNVGRPEWQAVNDAAVIVSSIEVDDVGAWIWQYDGRIWIVRGQRGAAGDYVARVIDATGAGSDPFNYQGLTGRLADRMPDLPGWLYVDLPRATVLANMPNTLAGPCADSLYSGYVVPADDPDWQLMAPEDLGWNIMTVAPGCVDGGFMDELMATLDGDPELRRGTLGGRDVYRNDNGLVHFDGRLIIEFYSQAPATVVAMEPFMEAFLAAQ